MTKVSSLTKTIKQHKYVDSDMFYFTCKVCGLEDDHPIHSVPTALHSETEGVKGWEKEFDKRFGVSLVEDKTIKLTIADAVYVTDGADRIKSFIRDLLATTLAEEREERVNREGEIEMKAFVGGRDYERALIAEQIEDYGRTNTTIDRIDNDGSYCKENCKWSTRLEQAYNKRTSSPISQILLLCYGTVDKRAVDRLRILFRKGIAEERESWIKEIEGMKKDFCPSCLNNELDNPNNWCEEFREQTAYNQALDAVLALLKEDNVHS